jgi:hypothetical protein
MDTFDTMFSTQCTLHEQLAREVFDRLPEAGLLVAILDRAGNCWASDSEAFGKLGLTEELLTDVRSRVDDGVDPVTVQIAETLLTVTQLAAEQANCGYVMVALPQAAVTTSSIDLVEALLGQIGVVARLLERNEGLARAATACLRGYTANTGPTN